VITRRGCRSVHTITLDQKEWLIVVSCINARGETIPNFYIFKEKKKSRNFIRHTREKGVVWAMQPKV